MRTRTAFALAAVAVVLYGSAYAAESRDPDNIGRVIDQHKAEITAIYNTYLDAGLGLEGTVVVKFTIARTGAVTESEVAEATNDCELFEEAVAGAVAKWDFGPTSGDAVTVRYPFTFTLPDEVEEP